MFQTRITQLFGIRHPIIQAGMRHVSQGRLAAAVANAGGLGFMTAHSFSTPDDLHREIELVRSLTDKPFGVNLTILSKLTVRPEDSARVIVEAGVRYVETAGGNPAKFIELFKSHGIKVLHKCTAVRFALKAQQLGADAVSLTSFEAAGHPGEDHVTSMVLIPAAAARLQIPIVANGGLTDGRALVAALALGAEGISMGTRFMLTRESPMHDAVKARYLAASERGTTLICGSVGDSTRVLQTQAALQIKELESKGEIGHDELLALASSQRWIDASLRGDPDGAAFAAGMGVGLIDDLPSCQDLIQRIMMEAAAVIQQRLFGMVADDLMSK